MLAKLAEWAAPAQMSVAYPGLWVRPDVYATHGHYLDCHLTVPTIERLSVAAMSRVLGLPAASFSRVEDYEAVGAPVFAWRDAVAREARMGHALKVDTIRAWRALSGDGGGSSRLRKLRGLALAGAFPLAVAALNRAGLGPLRTDISTEELRRAGLRAMGEDDHEPHIQRANEWLLETWSQSLGLGLPLPTMPLWLADDLAVPLELEESYEQSCHVLNIP